MLKTWGNSQTLATGDTHLTYHPACSWPKAQTSVNPPPAGPAEEHLGEGRACPHLHLSLSGHKVLTQSLAQSKRSKFLSYYYYYCYYY